MQAVFRSKHEFIFKTRTYVRYYLYKPRKMRHEWKSYVRKSFCIFALSAYTDSFTSGEFSAMNFRPYFQSILIKFACCQECCCGSRKWQVLSPQSVITTKNLITRDGNQVKVWSTFIAVFYSRKQQYGRKIQTIRLFIYKLISRVK